MRIVSDKPAVIFPIALGERKIGVLNGRVEVDSTTELHEIISVANRIWRIISRRFPDFIGIIRFDFVPAFDDRNRLSIQGIYEINTNSPECLAALAALRVVQPELVPPDFHRRFVRAVIETFKCSTLPIVMGNGAVKRAWGEQMVRVLRENGLSVFPIAEEEVMSISPPPFLWRWVLWRWGDITDKRSEFSSWFVNYLYLLATKPGVKIFNTLPKDGLYPGHKTFLLTKEIKQYVGFACRLTLRNLPRVLLGRQKIVLKPLNGSSGEGLVFGKLTPKHIWPFEVFRKYKEGNYGAFYAQWLPTVMIFEREFVADFNATFWAQGRSLKYLYSIMRFTPLARYEFFPVVNVAKGGFFAAVWET